jgi:type II secretory ATPase GspE/PulE/Tfp pilus assembly ATPase PilB-like protein
MSPSGDPSERDEFTELSHFQIDRRAVRRLRYDYCLRHSVVVLGPLESEPVPVGVLDPDRRDLIREVAAALGRAVRPVQLNAFEIRRALDIGYGHVEATERAGTALELAAVAEIRFDPELPVAEVLDDILGRAVELQASDVHLECYEQDVDVRFRVDGRLRQIATPLSRNNVETALARLKVLADLDIAERRRSQDGRIRAVFQDGKARRAIDFRLSVVPGPFGEDAVLRILDSTKPLVGLTELGLPEGIQEELERMIGNPEGLVLVTGPTGSGKTTTLYAALQQLKAPETKILTAEDPIEYDFPKVNQKQISPTMGFAHYARAFLRQNPDVILIGEIRDEETAEAALRAAQTGHLVLSTLHANDAVRTVARLLDLKVERGLLAGSLLGALSQRLIRRLCPDCRYPAPAEPQEAARLRLAPEDPLWFRATGCSACGGTGYRGRIGLFELFAPNDDLADRIAEGMPIHLLREAAQAAGMRSLLDDALDKARAGLTSLAEILRTVPYRMMNSGASP